MRKAREINDSMPAYIAQDFLKQLIKQKINPVDCKISLLGFTFKENCPDTRNTKVYDLYLMLKNLGFSIEVYDPWLNKEALESAHSSMVIVEKNEIKAKVALLAVGHTSILNDIRNKELTFDYIYDFKGFL